MAEKKLEKSKPNPMSENSTLRKYKDIQLNKLVKYEGNSRTHSEAQIAEIATSIEHYGFTNPLLIDENNLIIAGHGRLEAAKKLGMDSVPCIVIDGLDKIEKKALIIADNKIALNAGWDPDLLRSELEFFKENDFDIALTGFTEKEFDELFPTRHRDGLVDDDDVPDLADGDPVSKRGDVWMLGDHRLVCGDSTNITDVEKLLDGQSPNTMITDPPYGVKYEADRRPKAKGKKKTDREQTSRIANDDRSDWYDAYVLFPGNVAYVWYASAFTDIVMDSLRRSGFEIKQQIIWNKNVHALSRADYHWKHEPCWYVVKKTKERNWRGGRNQMTVWDVQIGRAHV